MTFKMEPTAYFVWANYIDTCYPDYLTDGYNRDNEMLLCCPALGQSLQNGVIDLLTSMENGEADKLPDEIKDSTIFDAVYSVCRGVDFTGLLEEDVSLEDNMEVPYVYVVLTWERVSDES